MLSSADIPLAPLPSRIGMLPAPGNLRAQPGLAQICKISCKRLRGAKTYIGECGLSATGPLTQVYVGTKASFIATG